VGLDKCCWCDVVCLTKGLTHRCKMLQFVHPTSSTAHDWKQGPCIAAYIVRNSVSAPTSKWKGLTEGLLHIRSSRLPAAVVLSC
jgi:hypothetical protein